MEATSQVFRYDFPTTIYFGPGARHRLPAALKETKVTCPLVVTDRGLSKHPVVHEVVASLGGFDVMVFSEIWGNPVASQVRLGVKNYKESKRDGIVAVGGGAAQDVAKAIALMAHHPGDLFDYEDGKPGALPVNQRIPFLAAIPTTAGTGSEVGRSAVISDDSSRIKRVIFDPKLLPQRVFADPELTLSLPADLTASTGMDALTHLVEAYLANGQQPLCDGIALEGMRLVAKSLQRCVDLARAKAAATAEHVAVRGMMLNAALMGAVAFQKGLGVTHSCAHALSTVCDLHHGMANGILLPYTMAFNASAARERFVHMAQAVGASGPDGFVAWLEKLKAEIGIPEHLSAVGVSDEHLPKLVQCALNDGCHRLNPRPVGKADFEHLFTKALH